MGRLYFPAPAAPPPVPVPEEEPTLVLLREMVTHLAQLAPQPPAPAPVVTVAAPDLSEIVAALSGIKPGLTAADIEAIRLAMPPSTPPDELAAMLKAVGDALAKVDFRLKAGSTGVSTFGAGVLLGHVTVDNLPATQPVSGTVTVDNFPATQPVSGTVDVTDRSGRLVGHVTVDNFPATQPVSGSVSVSNFPATQPVSGTVTANQGGAPWTVTDDNTQFEAQHLNLAVSTDTTVTFATSNVRLIRIKNWDTANRVLVKNGAISSNTDTSASRVGIAPTANVPGEEYFPFKSQTIHLRSAGASEVTVEAFA